MATPRHCRGCGQVHDLLLPCPKPLPKTLADLEKLKVFTKSLVSRAETINAGSGTAGTSYTAKPIASVSNQRCPTCKQRIRKPKKRKRMKRA